jgi:two-component sensor histidine kinase
VSLGESFQAIGGYDMRAGPQVEEIVVTTFSPETPVADLGTLLRELNHRINNQFASAISSMTVEAVRAQGAEAKAVLSNAVELLHGYADVHRALLMPRYGTLIDAARYLRKVCRGLHGALLDRLNIQLTLKGDALPLQPERCWRLGLIVHEFVTNAAKHACFDGRPGEIRIKLARRDGLVNCVVSDNGSAAIRARHEQRQGLRIVGDLARSLGGRIEQGVGTDFRSFVLAFPLTERERQASCTIDSRRVRPSRQVKNTPSGAPGERGTKSLDHGSRPIVVASPSNVPPARGGELASCGSTDPFGELLSSSHRMDVL